MRHIFVQQGVRDHVEADPDTHFEVATAAGDDVIVRSRDHGGRPGCQCHMWSDDVNHILMLQWLLLLVAVMIYLRGS